MPTSDPNSDSFALYTLGGKSKAPGLQVPPTHVVPRPLPPVIVGDLRFKKVQKQLNSVTTQISAVHKLVKICCVCDTPAENKARNNLGELRRQDQVATTTVIQKRKGVNNFAHEARRMELSTTRLCCRSRLKPATAESTKLVTTNTAASAARVFDAGMNDDAYSLNERNNQIRLNSGIRRSRKLLFRVWQ
ncbi:hypothetical protein C8R43DRAFT_1115340 [Mycena crocata]|nr:hypothetical protein C8R43DRAFT_1115340 [Mycena crocata]